MQSLSGLVLDKPPSVPTADAALAREAEQLIPQRNSWRQPPESKLPASVRRGLEELRQRQDAKAVNFATVWPWADGKRTLLAIWELMRYKHPCDLRVLIDYFTLMAKGKAVKWVPRSGPV